MVCDTGSVGAGGGGVAMVSELPSVAQVRLEDALYKELGRAVVLFSQLDLNVSLCLLNLKSEADLSVAKARIDSLSMKEKLEELQCGIIAKFKVLHPKLVSDFDEWFSEARKIRQLRNDFVHGRWGISPVRKEICFVPGGLPTGTANSVSERRYQLSEFEEEIGRLAALLIKFGKLREIYRIEGL